MVQGISRPSELFWACGLAPVFQKFRRQATTWRLTSLYYWQGCTALESSSCRLSLASSQMLGKQRSATMLLSLQGFSSSGRLPV